MDQRYPIYAEADIPSTAPTAPPRRRSSASSRRWQSTCAQRAKRRRRDERRGRARQLGARGYDIVIGGGLFERAGELIAPGAARASACRRHGRDRRRRLHWPTPDARPRATAGIASRPGHLPAGEATKSFAQLEAVLERGCWRAAPSAADLAGARRRRDRRPHRLRRGILLRGIDFIQVPTTLLAQVDSSVGGKTGINTAPRQEPGRRVPPAAAGAGRYRRRSPRLPRARAARRLCRGGQVRPDRRAGFFAWLETNGAKLLDGDAPRCAYAVATSCRAKARIVGADEREAGARALLNLGHTFGHALEAATAASATRCCTARRSRIGMVLAFDSRRALGLAPAADARAGAAPSAARRPADAARRRPRLATPTAARA